MIASMFALALAATTTAAEPEPGQPLATVAAAAATTTAAGAPAAAPVAQPAPVLRYCVKFEFTGTRIPRTRCDTHKGWVDKGFDIDAALAERH